MFNWDRPFQWVMTAMRMTRRMRQKHLAQVVGNSSPVSSCDWLDGL